ncbi:MAG: DUF465 domain-containing protein [Pseudomonadota bacterium]
MDERQADPDQDNADGSDAALERQLTHLKEEHRDLDAAIAALSQGPVTDALAVQRLKKKKLMLKDRIALLEDKLLPDIIA